MPAWDPGSSRSRSPQRRPHPRHSPRTRRQRSPSGSPDVRARLPVESQGAAKGTEFGKARILKTPNTGRDDTWKAEIDIEAGEVNHVGRKRIMSIRGPSRPSVERAEEDARKLEEAVPRGPQAVRAVGNQLQRTRKGTAGT
mmetsp:Transcript_103420/g.205570  ORF Transcript_103420/g.205570 Transcript_103420/m.205570 type:complete len:141 (-) Transcript_103420:146-568(-)